MSTPHIKLSLLPMSTQHCFLRLVHVAADVNVPRQYCTDVPYPADVNIPRHYCTDVSYQIVYWHIGVHSTPIAFIILSMNLFLF